MAKPVPGLVEHLLVKSDFSPLLSPELAARVKSPEDLLKLPILDPLDEWFGQRFAEAGVEGYSSEGRSVSQMGLQSLLGRAAMAGILSGVSGKPTKFTQDQGIPGLDFGGDGLYAAA